MNVSGWCGHHPPGARPKCDQCPGCDHHCHNTTLDDQRGDD